MIIKDLIETRCSNMLKVIIKTPTIKISDNQFEHETVYDGFIVKIPKTLYNLEVKMIRPNEARELEVFCK